MAGGGERVLQLAAASTSCLFAHGAGSGRRWHRRGHQRREMCAAAASAAASSSNSGAGERKMNGNFDEQLQNFSSNSLERSRQPPPPPTLKIMRLPSMVIARARAFRWPAAGWLSNLRKSGSMQRPQLVGASVLHGRRGFGGGGGGHSDARAIHVLPPTDDGRHEPRTARRRSFKSRARAFQAAAVVCRRIVARREPERRYSGGAACVRLVHSARRADQLSAAPGSRRPK